MADLIDSKERLEDIHKQVSILSSVDPKALSRKDELSKNTNFEKVVPIISELLEQFKPLYRRDLSKLPKGQLDNIHHSFSLMIDFINEIKSFKIEECPNPSEICDQIINRICENRDTMLKGILLPLAVTGVQAINVEEFENQSKELLFNLEKKQHRINSVLEQSNKDADEILASLRKTAAHAGVSSTASDFKEQSQKHFWSSVRWLIATCLSVVLTAGVAIYFLQSVTGTTTISKIDKTAENTSETTSAETNMPQSVPEAIQYIFAKLVIFSTLTFTIVLCSKNYKSHKHNQTLYDHRATTLDTFQAFYNGSNDEHVKDAILLQAAYAAFGNRQTGFESIQEKDSPPPMQIVDVLNKTVRTAGSVSKDIS